MALVRSGVVALALVAAFGCSPDPESTGIPRGNYEVRTVTSAEEFGELIGFNSHGQVLTRGGTHQAAILDIDLRTFTSLGSQATVIALNEDGEVLYRPTPGNVALRNADGRIETILLRIPGYGEFNPVALAPGGVVWGITTQQHLDSDPTPGFAALKDRVVSGFRSWGDHPPDSRKLFRTIGANGRGQLLFCQTQNGSEIPGNGFPKEECFIAQPDGTNTDLNPLYKNAFRAVPTRLNERGEVGGQVDLGDVGLQGSFPFLYSPPEAYVVGDQFGTVIALNDVGDVLYSQLTTPAHVLLRKANGEKFDLSDYIRNPVNVNREINTQDILGMDSRGRVLIKVSLDADDKVRNVQLLTPK